MARIDLLDCGKQVDVTFLSGKVKTINNSDFHTSNQEEFAGNVDQFGELSAEFFPMRIGQQSYLIDKRGRIENMDVFKAVCNGYAIDLSVMQDSKGQSNIIDI